MSHHRSDKKKSLTSSNEKTDGALQRSTCLILSHLFIPQSTGCMNKHQQTAAARNEEELLR